MLRGLTAYLDRLYVRFLFYLLSTAVPSAEEIAAAPLLEPVKAARGRRIGAVVVAFVVVGVAVVASCFGAS